MLREETVEPGTLELLKKLTSLPQLSEFRLVGGTALSLLLGHRKSIDIDLFTDKVFNKAQVREFLENHFIDVSVLENKSPAILQCFIENIKTDFVSVKDPFSHLPQYYNSIPFAHMEDIIALKLNAIKGRGSKKDFWDLAKLADIYKLENILEFYQRRYPYDDIFALMRSIVYFDDAEQDPDPVIVEKITWKQVKSKITKAFKNYYTRNI